VNRKCENQFSQFRLQLYQKHFNKRDDSLMDLVDALASNTQARSVVELSISPLFRRDYNSLFKAIAQYQPVWVHQNLAQLAAPYLPPPQGRPFWLLGVDVTAYSRPYALRLADRGYVYQPNPVRINQPVTIGHQYSTVCLLPDRAQQESHHWVVPLSTKRVVKWDDQQRVGSEQIRLLLEDDLLPWANQLCAEVADSSYGKPAYLSANRDKANFISIVRVRSNRVFYRQPEATENTTQWGPPWGHPTWYGARFPLGATASRPLPDIKLTPHFTNRQGRVYRMEIEAWYNLLMHGEMKPNQIPMQNYPFTLLRIRRYNEKRKLVDSKPMWLIVMGENRHRLSLEDIVTAYLQRYDIEHFFRFGKQRLLMDRYQTPEVTHEEHWWQIAHLAYLQLWVARQYASNLPRPWERYLPEVKEKSPSPSMVQRSLGEIIRQFGTPACIPKRRGNSPGRLRGKHPVLRSIKPVTFLHRKCSPSSRLFNY
jgi:hypothetical protein